MLVFPFNQAILLGSINEWGMVNDSMSHVTIFKGELKVIVRSNAFDSNVELSLNIRKGIFNM